MATGRQGGSRTRGRRWCAPRPLVRGQGGIVAFPEDEPLMEAVGDAQARLDDALWLRFVLARPFSWMAFVEWWCARRWVQPRDARRVRAEQRA